MHFVLHSVPQGGRKGGSVPFDRKAGPEYRVFTSLDSVWRVIIAPYNWFLKHNPGSFRKLKSCARTGTASFDTLTILKIRVIW